MRGRRQANWACLVTGCAATCQYKYPIRDGIPVMRIEKGDKYRAAPLPEIPFQ